MEMKKKYKVFNFLHIKNINNEIKNLFYISLTPKNTLRCYI